MTEAGSATQAEAALRLTVVHPDRGERARWCRALQSRLPRASVVAWTSRQAGRQSGVSGPAIAHPADGPAAGQTGQIHFGVGWRPPAAFFSQHPDLAAFFTAGAGVDHLLGLEGLPPLLPIIRLEDAGMADQMHWYCLHEILRRLNRAQEYEAQQHLEKWRELSPRTPARLRIGIVGLGALGGDLARRLAAQGFSVSGFARSAHQIHGVSCHHGSAHWPIFLGQCDVLILMAPLTAGTRHMIDAKALSLLPADAWLVNVARGGLIDESALLKALADGSLAGATLDVFDTEPLPAGHPFWQHPKIRLTPHVAAQTLIEPGASQVADKILRLQQGESVSGIVNRQRGY